jgi:hypothetical protein
MQQSVRQIAQGLGCFRAKRESGADSGQLLGQ